MEGKGLTRTLLVERPRVCRGGSGKLFLQAGEKRQRQMMSLVRCSKSYDFGVIRNVVSFYRSPKPLHDGFNKNHVVS